MKKNMFVFLISISIVTLAQCTTYERILISHSYEDLYLTYITPVNCNDKLMHGPLEITDSLIILKIKELLEKSTQSENVDLPDVRFKLEFYSKNRINTLCFGQSNEGMLFSDKKYIYNEELCEYIIDIIEKSGAKEPAIITTPNGSKIY
jgi:hypothetical protein